MLLRVEWRHTGLASLGVVSVWVSGAGHRYPHFRDDSGAFRNPFDKGFAQNVLMYLHMVRTSHVFLKTLRPVFVREHVVKCH